MRKIILLVMLFATSLSACTYPQASTPNPTANAIATQVAQKLTQTSDGSHLTAIPTATRPAASPTTKPGNPSATPPPVASTTPTPPALATPTPTLTSTTTATIRATGATATATIEPGDPKAGLGEPTLKDTFQKPASWGLASPYDDGHTRVSMTPGKIILTSLEGNKWHGWRMYSAKVQNFYLEVAIQTGSCSGADQYGLVFRSPDNLKGYWFGVTCDGNYTLEYGDIYNLSEIIKAKTNPLIKSGSNQANRLGVMANGNKLSLYANGKLLEEINSSAFTGTGGFGLFIAGAKTVNFTYESTELAYWKLP